MRWILLGSLFAGLLLTGCAPRQPQSPPQPIVPAEVSSDVTATARQLFGDSLTDLRVDSFDLSLDEGRKAVVSGALSSEAPTGSQPYVLAAALAREFPGGEVYQVNLKLPGARFIVWNWIPGSSELQTFSGSSSALTGVGSPESTKISSGVTSSDLEAIANGEQPLPQYH